MERFSIECQACHREVGEGTRAESVPLAVSHLQQHHRAVGFPTPALSLIRLHPFYSLEVVSATEIEPLSETAAGPATSQQPEGGAAGGESGGGASGPPVTQN